jgi:fatty-acyl-CoA synthase
MKLSAWIDHWAELTPDKPAIIFDVKQQSYAELADAITRLTAVFQNNFGVKEGDRIAWLGYNSPRIIELLFVCARLGAILVPLNWRLARPELVQIVNDSGAGLLIADESHVETASAIANELDVCIPIHNQHIPKAEQQAVSWPCLQALMDQLIEVQPGSPSGSDFSENPVLILYTSGTTGKPKGVVLTQGALGWSARNSVPMHGMTAEDHVLAVLPMFHAGGFNIQTLPALSVGATMTLFEGFDPGAVLAEIDSGRPSLAGLVPAQINAMVSHPDWNRTKLDNLRCVTTGSTFVPDSCIEAWNQRGIPAIQAFGATETCVVAIHQDCENAEASRGSAGYAAKHCEIRLIDDNGQDVPPGVHGEILVKGPNIFKEYWRNPTATGRALRDGWFHTGDIAYQRSDGAYVISDRKADRIISGGENVYPAELEAILDEHPEIIESAVIGMAEERWGEVPVAYVVTSKDSQLDSGHVKALFENRLARFKHPRRVMLLNELPRNAMGKIEKFELRKHLQSEKDS